MNPRVKRFHTIIPLFPILRPARHHHLPKTNQLRFPILDGDDHEKDETGESCVIFACKLETRKEEQESQAVKKFSASFFISVFLFRRQTNTLHFIFNPHHLTKKMKLRLTCSSSFLLISTCLFTFFEVTSCYYIPSEALGTVLIPFVIKYAGKKIFQIGKMVGAHSTKNHGIHGGPIHHVFPTEYRVPSPLNPPPLTKVSSPPLSYSSPSSAVASYPGKQHYDDGYDDEDYDDDRDPYPLPRPPALHKNVVDAHYSQGLHYHYTRHG